MAALRAEVPTVGAFNGRKHVHNNWVGAGFVLAAALIAHNVGAQPVNSCPAGQVVQGSDASGRHLNCVPLPDVSGLQAQIEAEKTAREGMDTVLQDAIDELRPTEISGTYSFTGMQTCMNSTFGFNADWTPVPSPDPNRAAVVTLNSAVATGVRTFNSDGTGTSQIRTISTIFPGAFYSGSGFTGVTSAGTIPGGAAIPAGNGSIVEQSGTFSWRIEGNLLIIEDEPAPGVFTAGNRTGWSIVVTGIPRQVGVLGKDLRLIHVSHEALAVETNVITSPPNLPPQQFATPRICVRERLLRKM
jgi:hypothetical protein